MFFLWPGTLPQNGLSSVLETSEESESPETQVLHKLAQNIRNRQSENDFQNKDVIKDELSRKSVKVVTEEKEPKRIEAKGTVGRNYKKTAANAKNKVKQDVATKEAGQGLRQEIENH